MKGNKPSFVIVRHIAQAVAKRRLNMTPAKSKNQFRKMYALYEAGEITKAELDKFTKGVDFDKLPKRKGKPKPRGK